MKLFAISDIHLGYEINRQALATLPIYGDDWLILAGDVGETADHLRQALSLLTRRFARVIWVPGNHDLWTIPSAKKEEDALRGVAKYQHLVSICHEFGVLTPEDPYVIWPGEGQPALLAPLFVLYDYSFRPPEISLERAVAWAEEKNTVCMDEYVLHPDPYSSRIEWCRARYQYTLQRLEEVASEETPFILINHFPLRESLVQLKYIPRFSLWCGTHLTDFWHQRFPVSTVIYGHLHIRGTTFQDGVRFEEVSLGYPRQWSQERPLRSYLREILPGSGPDVTNITGYASL
jgi:3',5'-cyclic AMP phosphodiesterase CpdA